jgi:hypothetical protein
LGGVRGRWWHASDAGSSALVSDALLSRREERDQHYGRVTSGKGIKLLLPPVQFREEEARRAGGLTMYIGGGVIVLILIIILLIILLG